MLPPNLLRCDEDVKKMCHWDEDVDPLKHYETLDEDDLEFRETLARLQRNDEIRRRFQGR